jgi:hypothetical protein
VEAHRRRIAQRLAAGIAFDIERRRLSREGTAAVLFRSEPKQKIDLNFADRRCDQQQAAKRRRKSRGNVFMASIQPDNSDPIPLRASPHRMGTLMLRFVGLLFLTVAVLALLYSR